MPLIDTLIEKDFLPDSVIRWGIRRLLKQRLADERIEVSHGGGAVKVVVDGHGRIQALTLHPDFLKEGAAVVEPALVTALQEAADRAREGRRRGQREQRGREKRWAVPRGDLGVV